MVGGDTVHGEPWQQEYEACAHTALAGRKLAVSASAQPA